MKMIEKIKNSGLPVIIFGARSVGEALYFAAVEAGIKIECFCDNNLNKTKTLVCKTQVIHPSLLKKKYKDAIFLISAADLKDVVEQLNYLGYRKWYPSTIFLRNFDVFRHEYSFPADFVEYAVKTCLLCHDSYLTPEKLFLRSVDLMVTERCSLRCRDCSNLMRYYQNPQNFDLGQLYKNMDRFFQIIDEINEVRILGGEPFMYKDVHLVIEKLIKEPKVKKIIIYTNGTIAPTEHQLRVLKSGKVLFIITDYGELSRNLNNLTKQLSEKKIAFYVQKAGGWTNCAKIKKHDRNSKQQEELFRNCCAKNTITLSDKNLFRCPFSANAHRLRAVPDYKDDYVDISAKNIKAIKKEMRTYLLAKEFLKTCDFCNGRSFGDPLITPAIQRDKPLKYEHYQY